MQSTKGESALSMTARKERDDIVQFLLAQGALTDLKSEDQWTPLMYAADNGKPRAMRILLKHGAFVDATDKTALDGFDARSIQRPYEGRSNID